MGLVSTRVPGTDRQQARELALGSRVGLERDRVVAGDGAQVAPELTHELVVARQLVARRVRMNVREFRPRDGDHLGGRVELHRARPERNHRAVEGEVLVGERAHVAQELGLGAVALENGMREEGGAALEVGWNRVGERRRGGGLHSPCEDRLDLLEVVVARRFVECDADRAVIDTAEVVARRHRRRERFGGFLARAHHERVEERPVRHVPAGSAQAACERARFTMDCGGDRLQALGPVIHRVEARDDRRQYLGGADVARRVLAADVLLARLQRQAVGARAVGVERSAHQASRQGALERVRHRDVSRVRPAAAHRHAEALGRADRDLGAELARRFEQRQRQEVGGDDDDRAPLPQRRDCLGWVDDFAGRVRVLEQRAECVGRAADCLVVDHAHFDPERCGARAHHRNCLRMARARDDECLAVRFRRRAVAHRHRLGCCGRFVEQRRVGNRKRRQVRDEGLEIHQQLEPPLRDLGLVGRVRRVPGGVFEDVAEDHRRRVTAVIAHADHRSHDAVCAGDAAQVCESLRLAARCDQCHGVAPADARGHGGVHERVERTEAEAREHPGNVVRTRTDVAVCECVRGQGQRNDRRHATSW